MSAQVLTIHDCRIQASQNARKRVEEALGHIRPDRVPEAQARAERLVLAGTSFHMAVHRATAWGLYANDPSGPEAA
jgi:hypothetical protein